MSHSTMSRHDHEDIISNIAGLDTTGQSNLSSMSTENFLYDGLSSLNTSSCFDAAFPMDISVPHQTPRSLPSLARTLLPQGYISARSARHMDEPWNPAVVGYSCFDIAQEPFADYRSAVPSDCGMSNALPSDSGYGTWHSIGNPSTYGGGELDTNYGDTPVDDAQSIVSHIGHVNLNEQKMSMLLPLDEPAPLPEASTSSKGQAPITCSTCPMKFQSKSLLRKHLQKYHKTFFCEYPGCKRTNSPFGTSNDLSRHVKSVHQKMETPGDWFQCTEGVCAAKEKKWPRADNFRSHLRRVHQREVSADFDLKPYLGKPQKKSTECSAPSDMPPLIRDTSLTPIQNTAALIQDTLAGICGSTRSPQMGFEADLSDSDCPLQDPLCMDFPSNSRVQSFGDYSLDSIVSRNTASQSPDLLLSMDGFPESSAAFYQRGPDPFLMGRLDRPYQQQACQSNDVMSPARERSRAATPAWGANDASGVDLHHQTEILDSSLSTDSVAESVSATEGEYVLDPHFPAVSEDAGPPSEGRLFRFLDSLPRALLEKFLNKDFKPLHKGVQVTQISQHCCHECNKSFARKCELKKHMKRHDKPYGCTFPDCKKSFGSKNDWKRHESSQHFQFEIWACDVADCRQQCNRRETFRTHLSNAHQITEPKVVETKLDACRNGRSCDDQFWCGFCCKDIKIAEEGVAAWTERFNHIDDHFSGRSMQKMKIKDWKKPGGVESNDHGHDHDHEQDDGDDEEDGETGTDDDKGDCRYPAVSFTNNFENRKVKRSYSELDEENFPKRLRMDSSST